MFATINEDGTPYGLPMSFAYEEGIIYMHGAKAEGQRITNVKNRAKASFTVIANTELLPESFATRYMSAIAFGNASVVESDEEKRKGLEALIRKYSSAYLEKGMKYIDAAIDQVYVIKLEVNELTGKGRKK